MSSGWTCSHAYEEKCELVKKVCEPGMKGCTLYGKALFTNPDNSAQKRDAAVSEDEKEASLQAAIENAKFF